MPKRIDRNQVDVVSTLRSCGASVVSLADLGRGTPDLIAGFMGKNYLIEVKSAKGKLTPPQVKWHASWRGQVCIVRSTDDVLRLLEVTHDR